MDNLIKEMINTHFNDSITVKQNFLNDSEQIEGLISIAKLCVETYKRGNKILIAGNGGSAADAQHFAGELVSRFNFDRPPLAAIALTTDTSIITAIGNDYSYDNIFSRQIKAIGKKEDLLIAISTSGKSRNIQLAIQAARETEMYTIGLEGMQKNMSSICDYLISVPSLSTPIIQECHLLIEHLLCEYIEKALFSEAI